MLLISLFSCFQQDHQADRNSVQEKRDSQLFCKHWKFSMVEASWTWRSQIRDFFLFQLVNFVTNHLTKFSNTYFVPADKIICTKIFTYMICKHLLLHISICKYTISVLQFGFDCVHTTNTHTHIRNISTFGKIVVHS